MTFVYVRNQDGQPLMPCTPAKARKLLRAGKASVVKRSPFTIQLAWLCEGHVQEVRVGIDKGSYTTGICCTGNEQVLLSAEIHHRRDVKAKMDDRRERRESRRGRKWYRPARFDNRASGKRSGRLPPSVKTNALCIATYHTEEQVTAPESNVYAIGFRPRQTRKQYHSLPQKGQGRVRYQRYEELGGLRKGDIVRVKGKWIKQINAIYAEGRVAFQRVKGEPPSALPRDCQLLEREQTIIWEQVS
jgi:RRXRR protein